ncbi:MAG: hypothetical protein WC586_05425 [Methanoregula sp.]
MSDNGKIQFFKKICENTEQIIYPCYFIKTGVTGNAEPGQEAINALALHRIKHIL